jgi:glycosyltransferase involved in cell wall biosynthesis
MNLILIALGILSSKHFSAGPLHVAGLSKAMAAKGCHLTILTSRAGETQLKNYGLDAEFWCIGGQEQEKEPCLARVPFIMINRMLRAALLLRKMKFAKDTVIFATSNLLWEVFPLLFVRDKSLVRIATFHMGYPSPFKGYRGAFTTQKKFPSPRETLAYLQHKLALPCIKYGSDIIISHRNMSHLLLEYGVAGEKIVGMDVGVDWDVINAAKPSERKYEACWVGRFNPQKGCDDLLEIWEVVARANRRARLAVMGNVESQLNPAAEQKKLEANIEFFGPVSETDKYRVMKESSLFLFPSYYEAVPLAIIEAMACGLPVVAYDLPVYQSHFPGGIIKVPIGDKQAFAREVMNILSDRERRESLASQAFNVASRYRWEIAAERLITEVERLKNNLSNA